MAKSRIYQVDILRAPTAVRLVRASSQAQAIRHVAEGLITADIAGQEALVKLLGNGVKVEDAGEETAAPEELKEAAE